MLTTTSGATAVLSLVADQGVTTNHAESILATPFPSHSFHSQHKHAHPINTSAIHSFHSSIDLRQLYAATCCQQPTFNVRYMQIKETSSGIVVKSDWDTQDKKLSFSTQQPAAHTLSLGYPLS